MNSINPEIAEQLAQAVPPRKFEYAEFAVGNFIPPRGADVQANRKTDVQSDTHTKEALAEQVRILFLRVLGQLVPASEEKSKKKKMADSQSVFRGLDEAKILAFLESEKLNGLPEVIWEVLSNDERGRVRKALEQTNVIAENLNQFATRYGYAEEDVRRIGDQTLSEIFRNILQSKQTLSVEEVSGLQSMALQFKDAHIIDEMMEIAGAHQEVAIELSWNLSVSSDQLKKLALMAVQGAVQDPRRVNLITNVVARAYGESREQGSEIEDLVRSAALTLPNNIPAREAILKMVDLKAPESAPRSAAKSPKPNKNNRIEAKRQKRAEAAQAREDYLTTLHDDLNIKSEEIFDTEFNEAAFA